MGYVPPVRDAQTVQYESRIPIKAPPAVRRKQPVEKIRFLTLMDEYKRDGALFDRNASIYEKRKEIEQLLTKKGRNYDEHI
ncbi:hypothetical protein [Bacillus alkalicellulosilyticus]|uniref:hypothetical protein n=1 Tax=Alkalihalobacterium alkalicellulosilyticum TaxID=1912214 RepID=UPI0009989DAD|nr:hypothetical protein [Bacillus alkalicellulosilyticus]